MPETGRPAAGYPAKSQNFPSPTVGRRHSRVDRYWTGGGTHASRHFIPDRNVRRKRRRSGR